MPGTPILMSSPYDFTVTIDIELPSERSSFIVSRMGDRIDFHVTGRVGSRTR